MEGVEIKMATNEINLDAEIEELAEQIATEGAMFVQRQLMEEMPELMNDYFYDLYTPIRYKRTDNLRNNSYFPYAVKGKGFYEGGIEVSDMYMFEYPTGTWTPQKVIDTAWMKGDHGHRVITPPSIYDRTVKYVQSKEFEDKVWSHILRVAFS